MSSSSTFKRLVPYSCVCGHEAKTAEPTSKEFADLLRAWRADNEFSQRDAACVLGINKRTLENWEQERAMITGYGLQQLLRKLHQKRIKLPRL